MRILGSMKNMLIFSPVTQHNPGTIFSLLRESYAPIWNDKLQENLRKTDRETFENADTIGACTLITCLDDKPIGFACYDPRPGPDLAVIGHNCIIPQYQHQGFGGQQIAEIIRRLQGKGFSRVTVTTSDHPFFVSAQSMYLVCGFRELRRFNETPDSECQTIEYEFDIEF
ncbi:MAG: GNAT family N-acetyltransferase [Actinobacteria bacterium]|nr:GNAT family N-acetyltransferase [Actinomycetota bacterium]